MGAMKRWRAFALACAVLSPTGVAGQVAYPEKPVRLIVPLPVGGAPDAIARLLAERWSQAWGQQVVVENLPGAAGNIGVTRAAKSAPDGYTLVLSGDAAIVVNVGLYGNLGYDPVRDLMPITQVGITPNILVVNNDVPAKTLSELVALARTKPGHLSFASAGFGTSQHIGGELLNQMAGVNILHVPYKDPYINDLIGGHVQLAFNNIVTALPLVRAGKLRGLAVSSAERVTALPEVPTVAELGYPGFHAVAWFGLLAPAGTPDPIIRKVHAETAKALGEPAFRGKLTDRGIQVVGSTPEEFAALIKAEIPRIGALVKARGLKAD